MTRSSQNNNKKQKSAFDEMTAAAMLSDMPGIYFVKFIRTFQKFEYTDYSNYV